MWREENDIVSCLMKMNVKKTKSEESIVMMTCILPTCIPSIIGTVIVFYNYCIMCICYLVFVIFEYIVVFVVFVMTDIQWWWWREGRYLPTSTLREVTWPAMICCWSDDDNDEERKVVMASINMYMYYV